MNDVELAQAEINGVPHRLVRRVGAHACGPYEDPFDLYLILDDVGALYAYHRDAPALEHWLELTGDRTCARRRSRP